MPCQKYESKAAGVGTHESAGVFPGFVGWNAKQFSRQDVLSQNTEKRFWRFLGDLPKKAAITMVYFLN